MDRPLNIHSSTLAGDSTEVALAASTNDSLIILTVNSPVSSMFSLVSFGRRGDRLNEMLTRGGLWETCHSKAAQKDDLAFGEAETNHRKIAVE